jgi:hypothetical protein
MEVSGVTAIESMPAAGARTRDHSPFRRNADSLTYDAPMAQLVIDEHPAAIASSSVGYVRPRSSRRAITLF